MSYWLEKVNHKNYYSSKVGQKSQMEPFRRNNEFLSEFSDYTHVKK